MCFIEEDKKILKEKGFNFITVYGDGVIKLFKIGLNAG